MERLTRRSKDKNIKLTEDLINDDFDLGYWCQAVIQKLAYYEDLEERIYSIFEDITIEMIVGEIESEHNKSIETILSLCKKLKEMSDD